MKRHEDKMMETLEIGRISSRGQIAIPSSIRQELGLEEGTKVIFYVQEKNLIMKPLKRRTWEEATRPLREAAAKAGFKEEEVVDMIHRMRAEKRKESQQTQTFSSLQRSGKEHHTSS